MAVFRLRTGEITHYGSFLANGHGSGAVIQISLKSTDGHAPSNEPFHRTTFMIPNLNTMTPFLRLTLLFLFLSLYSRAQTKGNSGKTIFQCMPCGYERDEGPFLRKVKSEIRQGFPRRRAIRAS